MSELRRDGRSSTDIGSDRDHSRSPGKTTLTGGLPPSSVVQRKTGGQGDSLPAPTRDRFEGSLGTSLSDVRVHTGEESAVAARSMEAQAFTVGQDIHFNAGRYQPDDPFGAHLLAHEVAHTVQQRGAAGAPQAKLEVSQPGDGFEAEADRAATAMVHGEPARVTAAAPSIARTPEASSAASPSAPGAAPAAPGEQAAEQAGAESGGDDREGAAEWDLATAGAMETGQPPGAAAGTGTAGAAPTAVQRSASGAQQEASADESVAAARGQTGSAPDGAVRRKVEAVTGTDLSAARVHTDAASHRAADAVGAHAFAVDQDIHFAAGQYQPGTQTGDLLLAHELVHTAQQSAGRGGVLQPQLALSQPGDAAEVEADRIAAAALGSRGSEGPTHPVREEAQGLHRNPAASVVSAVAKRALKWLASRGANVSAHIAKRHIANRLGKSTFTNGGKMVKKWVEDTLKSPGNIVDQGRRLVFEKAFGHPVGKGGEMIVRVVVDKATGKIVTAFPTQAFKTVMVAAVATAATSKAHAADAAILERREAVQKALEPSALEAIIDFIVQPSSVARDEDILAEERIIEQKIQEAITVAEESLKRSLSAEERAQVREHILLEMETEPTAGVVE